MQMPSRIAIVVGACGLAAAAAAAAGPGSVPVAAPSAASGSSVSALASVSVQPDVVHLPGGAASPPTTASCEKKLKLACYQPGQIEQAYNLPRLYGEGVTGAGTTIVIVDSFGSPTIRHDLSVFDRTFGLPAPPSLKVIAPVGKIPPYNKHNGDMVGWAGETTLDVEYAHTIAPGANILLVETPVSETEGVHGFPQIVAAEEYVVNHHLGDVISQSFSATEQTFPSRAMLNSLRGAITLAHQDKVTILAASGDSGAADVGLDGNTYYLYPVTSWQDSDPLVTGVGATQLHLGAHGFTAPTAWNDTYNKAANEVAYGNAGPNPLATGGGKSIYFARPWYQDSVQDVTGARRGVPDVAMSGACDGAVDTFSSFGGAPVGWSPACGTSESTPLFAGIVALASQVAGHSLGLINPALYQMSLQHAAGIVDVTSGNNTVTFPQGGHEHTVTGFGSRPGYDLTTGVGTVNALYFVPELAALAGH